MASPVSTSIQSFSQGWLGQFTSDPTLDGYGNPVIAGAQYYNSQSNTIRIYSGTAWSTYNPGDASAAANSANLAQMYAQQASASSTSANASAAAAAASAASVGNELILAENAAAAAQTSATAAAGSATSASTSASNAATSATSASTSATNAAASSTSANTAATNAAASATSASTSASSASGYATNAANSANSASTSATAASTSATNASTSAANAATSAGNALTSAGNAASSATSAAASAAEAAAAVGGIITIPLSNTNVTLTSAQFTNAIFVFTGSLSANIIVSVPATSHVFIAENTTTGAFTVTLGMTGGTNSVSVPQSKANSLFCDGTTGVFATSSVAGLQFSGTKIVASTTTLDSTYTGSRTAITGATLTTTLPLGSTLQSGASIFLDNQTTGLQTITANGSDTIDIGSPFSMQGNDKFLLSWDGSSWHTALYSNYLNPSFKNGVSVQAGQLTVTNTSTGTALGMTGTGGVTPAKSIGVVSGSLVVNNNSNSPILTLTDAGKLTVPNLDGTIIGANTAAAATVTTGSVTSTTASTAYTNGALIVSGGVGIAGAVNTNNSISANGEFLSYLVSPNTVTGSIHYNTTTNTNNASLNMLINSSTAIIGATTNGSGTAVPLTFQMNGTEYFRLSTGGKVLINTTTDDGTSALQVQGQLHLTQAGAGGGIEFGDGTIQTTANGTTAPVSTVYTPTVGTTSITTGGYTPGFIQVYQNGVRLVNGAGKDYTATDSVHIVLTNASGQGDTYEVLTAVIYSPQTIMTPSDTVYTPSSGTSTFTVTTYTVGFIDVYLNGSKLVGGQDYSATTGNSVTLIGFTANGTDQFDVKVWSTYTPANALPQTGGTITGPLTYTGGATNLIGFPGRLINIQVFSTPGTFTYTPTSGTTQVIVEIQAGGGGGGGVTASNGTNVGGSQCGAAGGFIKHWATSGFSGASVVVGAAGAAGANTGGNGGTGGTSSFGSLSALGGNGGAGLALSGVGPSNGGPATGGTASGGNLINAQGQPSTGTNYGSSTNFVIYGTGGSTQFGSGGISTLNNVGPNASGYGAGGAGVVQNASGTTARTGGTGSQGVVYVYEFS